MALQLWRNKPKSELPEAYEHLYVHDGNRCIIIMYAKTQESIKIVSVNYWGGILKPWEYRPEAMERVDIKDAARVMSQLRQTVTNDYAKVFAGLY